MDCLVKRGSIYQIVVTVPVDLLPLVGRKQIWKSTGAKTYRAARNVARSWIAKYDQLFTWARMGIMTRKEIDAIVARYALTKIEQITQTEDGFGYEGKSPELVKLLDEEHDRLSDPSYRNLVADTLQKLIDIPHINQGFNQIYSDNIERFIAKIADEYSISIDKNSRQYAALINDINKADSAIMQIESERLNNKHNTEFQLRTIQNWKEKLPPPVDNGLPLSTVIELFMVQYSKGSKKKNRQKERSHRVLLELAKKHFKKVPGVKQITADVAMELKEKLAKSRTYGGKTKEPLAPKTVLQYIIDWSQVFGWAVHPSRQYVPYNPFKGLGVKQTTKANKKRLELTDNELQSYFDLLADGYDSEQPIRSWLPVIVLYSGLRCNEIAQLSCRDVKQDDSGIWCFEVMEDEQLEKSAKTETSKAMVPIHSQLLELGLLSYRDELVRRGYTQLFPERKPNSDGHYYGSLSRTMNIVIRQVTGDRKKVVYSLRHNFENAIEHKLAGAVVDALDGKASFLSDLAGMAPFFERAKNDLMRHAQKGSTGDVVYRNARLPIMKRLLEQVTYNIELTNLADKLRDVGNVYQKPIRTPRRGRPKKLGQYI